MSAYVLSQESINLLTLATNAMLELNSKYCGSYPLDDNTINILGQYTGDLHNIYRALFITNLKAVNGRYETEEKTFPKYNKLHPWNPNNLSTNELKKACEIFGSYMYQISEEPIINTPIFKAIADIYKLTCMYWFSRTQR